MTAPSANESRVFKAGSHLYVVIGGFMSLFVVLGILIALKKGDYSFLGVALAGTALLFLLLQVLRLEIRLTGFRYRNLSGSRAVEFTDIARAYFDVLRGKGAPQGVARFWIERRDGSRVKINIRTFSIKAAATLFRQLEGHGIPIEVPDLWAARRAAEQVRTVQSKLRQRE